MLGVRSGPSRFPDLKDVTVQLVSPGLRAVEMKTENSGVRSQLNVQALLNCQLWTSIRCMDAHRPDSVAMFHISAALKVLTACYWKGVALARL